MVVPLDAMNVPLDEENTVGRGFGDLIGFATGRTGSGKGGESVISSPCFLECREALLHCVVVAQDKNGGSPNRNAENFAMRCREFGDFFFPK
jgi:hypothetical protein